MGSAGEVGIFVFDGVQLIDLAGPYEVFHHAGFRLHTIAAVAAPITAAGGLTFQPTYSFEDAPALDVLVIPGGAIRGSLQTPLTIEWLRNSVPNVRQVLSVCNGVHLLAKAGLLDGQNVTTLASAAESLRRAAPNATVWPDRVFVDNPRIVVAGVMMNGVSGALQVVKKLQGDAAAQMVAAMMPYSWPPEEVTP